jgi:predicted glycosyltransferase
MRILFFFVHPSKFHFFRHAINHLKAEGHDVEVAIVTKDVLEDLVKGEGWKYTNIIPHERRSRRLPRLLGMLYFSLQTIWRLILITRNKKYDLFVTDDLLVVIGKFRRVPTIMFTDDDLSVVKEAYPLLAMATRVITPACTDLGPLNHKKVGYRGYHELAYLSPKYFTPDFSKTLQFNPEGGKYFILRLVSLTATHDRGKKGISNDQVAGLIRFLEEHGKVYITSERSIPEEFAKYKIRIAPADIAHALYYAEMFIGDSQSMTSEAAVLGTPALRCNDFVGQIASMEEKEQVHKITYGFKSADFPQLVAKARELLSMPDLKQEWASRVKRMLAQCDDVNEVILREIDGAGALRG